MSFIFKNWSEIIGVAGAAHLVALAVVNLTPTPKDDEAYARFYKVIEKFAGLITKMAKK